MTQVNTLRKRHRFNSRMVRTVLLISLLFFVGRLVYSTVGAWQHQQDKIQSQQQATPPTSVDTPVAD